MIAWSIHRQIRNSESPHPPHPPTPVQRNISSIFMRSGQYQNLCHETQEKSDPIPGIVENRNEEEDVIDCRMDSDFRFQELSTKVFLLLGSHENPFQKIKFVLQKMCLDSAEYFGALVSENHLSPLCAYCILRSIHTVLLHTIHHWCVIDETTKIHYSF